MTFCFLEITAKKPEKYIFPSVKYICSFKPLLLYIYYICVTMLGAEVKGRTDREERSRGFRGRSQVALFITISVYFCVCEMVSYLYLSV